MYITHEQPVLPLDVVPREPEYMESERHYIIPEGVRPILRKFRIEVQNIGGPVKNIGNIFDHFTLQNNQCIFEVLHYLQIMI